MAYETSPRRGRRRVIRWLAELLALLLFGYFDISAYIASQPVASYYVVPGAATPRPTRPITPPTWRCSAISSSSI